MTDADMAAFLAVDDDAGAAAAKETQAFSGGTQP